MPPPRRIIPSLFPHLLRPTTTPLPLLPHPPHTRPASHASEGRANKAAQGPGKRLGAKKSALALVVPGNIIFKQRGTHWFPGENCGMGRDHTIFAREKGYVVYYRERWRNRLGERKFIGVVFERGEVLPRGEGAGRVRRLGLVGRERVVAPGEEEGKVGEKVEEKGMGKGMGKGNGKGRVPESQMGLKPGYQYRESNWSIGRAAERAGVKVRGYKRGDRFLAWRKREAKKARSVERRALSSRKKKGGK